MARLTDKTAIITGGARGMGSVTSRIFAEEGAKVIIADVLDEEGEKLAQELGDSVIFCQHDVTDEKSWQAITSKAETEFGKIDVLVNNAGVLLFKSIADTEKEEFERVLGVNLVGAFLGIKTVGPRMMARNKGSIIGIVNLV